MPSLDALHSGRLSAATTTAMPADEGLFLYLPFEHSEDPEHQALSVRMIGALGRRILKTRSYRRWEGQRQLSG